MVILMQRILYLPMSTPHAQERLETLYEEVKLAFPYLSEEQQAEIAMKRFDEELI